MTKLMGAFRDYADATKNRMEIITYKKKDYILFAVLDRNKYKIIFRNVRGSWKN